MSGGKRMMLQVTKSMGIPCKMLYVKGWSEFVLKKLVKTSTLKKLLSGADLQIKFHNFIILLNYEARNAEVLQMGVFKLKELLSLVRP